MKSLFISYDGMTDPLGQSQVLPYLVGLSKLGHQISIISCEKAAAFAKGKTIIEEICKGAGIDWHPLPYTKTPPLVSTLIDLRSIKKEAERLHRQKDFDLIHCRSYISALAGLHMKKKFGLKMIFDMRGFWADERVDGKIWNLSNPVFNAVFQYFKRKERDFFSKSDYVISLTEAGKEEIHGWDLPGQPIPIKVIPCCADLDHFSYEKIAPAQSDKLRKEIGIGPDNLVLCYLGSIGTWYLLDEMLAFFKELKEQNPAALFLFVTRDDPEFIKQQGEKIGIEPEALIIRPASREQVPVFLSLADLGIFFIKPVFSKKASSPTKQGEMMGMGLPLVCNSGIGDTDYIVEDSRAGLAIDIHQAGAIKAAQKEVKNLLQLPKTDIRAGAKKFYSLENGVIHYNEVYEQLSKD